MFFDHLITDLHNWNKYMGAVYCALYVLMNWSTNKINIRAHMPWWTHMPAYHFCIMFLCNVCIIRKPSLSEELVLGCMQVIQ